MPRCQLTLPAPPLPCQQPGHHHGTLPRAPAPGHGRLPAAGRAAAGKQQGCRAWLAGTSAAGATTWRQARGCLPAFFLTPPLHTHTHTHHRATMPTARRRRSRVWATARARRHRRRAMAHRRRRLTARRRRRATRRRRRRATRRRRAGRAASRAWLQCHLASSVGPRAFAHPSGSGAGHHGRTCSGLPPSTMRCCRTASLWGQLSQHHLYVTHSNAIVVKQECKHVLEQMSEGRPGAPWRHQQRMPGATNSPHPSRRSLVIGKTIHIASSAAAFHDSRARLWQQSLAPRRQERLPPSSRTPQHVEE